MNWIYLIVAGFLEIGWPLGLKLSQTNPAYKIYGIIIAIIAMTLSGFFLWLAQKSIPIGTAYAVWTGIGAVGTLVIGMVFFGDSTSNWRVISASLIVIGIIGLKMAK